MTEYNFKMIDLTFDEIIDSIKKSIVMDVGGWLKYDDFVKPAGNNLANRQILDKKRMGAALSLEFARLSNKFNSRVGDFIAASFGYANINTIKSGVYSLSDEDGMNRVRDRLNDIFSSDDAYNSFHDSYDKYCNEVQTKQEDRPNLVDTVLSYVQALFDDEGLRKQMGFCELSAQKQEYTLKQMRIYLIKEAAEKYSILLSNKEIADKMSLAAISSINDIYKKSCDLYRDQRLGYKGAFFRGVTHIQADLDKIYSIEHDPEANMGDAPASDNVDETLSF